MVREFHLKFHLNFYSLTFIPAANVLDGLLYPGQVKQGQRRFCAKRSKYVCLNSLTRYTTLLPLLRTCCLFNRTPALFLTQGYVDNFKLRWFTILRLPYFEKSLTYLNIPKELSSLYNVFFLFTLTRGFALVIQAGMKVMARLYLARDEAILSTPPWSLNRFQ